MVLGSLVSRSAVFSKIEGRQGDTKRGRQGESPAPTQVLCCARGILVCLMLAGYVTAAEERLHDVIDRLVALETPDYDKLAAPIASDEEFLRRVTLDLTGMIPATGEARVFLADADPNKREKLVD